MILTGVKRAIPLTVLCVAIAACGPREPRNVEETRERAMEQRRAAGLIQEDRDTIWDLFRENDTGTEIQVNKYLWRASLDVLSFLPVQAADPFTGVLVTGFGTPPGGGRAYRATVYVQDAALDARALKVALQTRGGAADTDTVREIEDAILSRARQLRIADRGR